MLKSVRIGKLVLRLDNRFHVGPLGVDAFAKGHVLHRPVRNDEQPDDPPPAKAFEQKIRLEHPPRAGRAETRDRCLLEGLDFRSFPIDRRVVGPQLVVGHHHVDLAMFAGPLAGDEILALAQGLEIGRLAQKRHGHFLPLDPLDPSRQAAGFQKLQLFLSLLFAGQLLRLLADPNVAHPAERARLAFGQIDQHFVAGGQISRFDLPVGFPNARLLVDRQLALAQVGLIGGSPVPGRPQLSAGQID